MCVWWLRPRVWWYRVHAGRGFRARLVTMVPWILGRKFDRRSRPLERCVLGWGITDSSVAPCQNLSQPPLFHGACLMGLADLLHAREMSHDHDHEKARFPTMRSLHCGCIAAARRHRAGVSNTGHTSPSAADIRGIRGFGGIPVCPVFDTPGTEPAALLRAAQWVIMIMIMRWTWRTRILQTRFLCMCARTCVQEPTVLGRKCACCVCCHQY